MLPAIFGALGTSLLSKLIDRGSSQVVDKVTGVPTPGQTPNPGGTEQGESMKSYMGTFRCWKSYVRSIVRGIDAEVRGSDAK
jgi:hypothetical protein